MAITITPAELSTSAKTYRRDLQYALYLALADAAQHMTEISGVRYKEQIGVVGGNFQLGNYDKSKHGNGDATIKGRTYRTFLGNLVEGIEPNKIIESFWGSDLEHADQMKETEACRIVTTQIMKTVGQNMFDCLFTAKHDPTDTTTTAKWFDGFCTVIEKDITGHNDEQTIYIKEDMGNLQVINAITEANAEDVLKGFYRKCFPVLRNTRCKMFVSDSTYFKYEDDYQATHGSAPFNTSIEQMYLAGTNRRVELVPLSNVPDDFILLTPRNNIKLVWNNKTDDERLYFKDSLTSHYEIDALMDKFFGTQFESVDRSLFCVGYTAEKLAEIRA